MSAGLIIAIGAQNAFVLKQGLMQRHVFITAAICAACDIVLIGIGIAGMGAVIANRPALLTLVTWGGTAFLIAYGLRSLFSAWRGGGSFEGDTLEGELASDLTFDREQPTAGLRAAGSKAPEFKTPELRATVLAALALSLLNPHVYLDTVLLLGSIGGRLPTPDRAIFAAGAISASMAWFFGLAYGASALAPLFRKPGAWRALDALVGVMMLAIAFALASGALGH